MAREQPLRRVRQRRAGSIDAAVIGRDQAVAIGNALRGGEARQPGRRHEPARNHRSPRDAAHSDPPVGGVLPVIIAMTRIRNPANQTMATWITRNATSNNVTKKCSVGADWRPPSIVTAIGAAETNAGDIARPVQMMSGKSPKMTRM